MLQGLVDDFPDIPDYRDDLGVVYGNLAAVLRQQGATEAAEKAATSAVEILQPLVDKHPKVLQYRLHLASYQNNLANVLKQSSQVKSAIEWYEKCVAINESIVADHPGVPEYADILARHLCNLADALWRDGQTDKCISTLQNATDVLQRLVERKPESGNYARTLAKVWWTLGDLFTELAGNSDAEAAYSRSLTVLDDACQHLPNNSTLQIHAVQRRGNSPSIAVQALWTTAGRKIAKRIAKRYPPSRELAGRLAERRKTPSRPRCADV